MVKRRPRPKRSLARRWVTAMRIWRYGAENFVRNAWLSLASMLIMTITLLVIFIGVASNNVLKDTINSVRDQVEMSIYVKNTIDPRAVETIKKSLSELKGVTSVAYESSSELRKQVAKDNADSEDILESLNEASNKLPSSFKVKIEDINNPSVLEKFVQDNELMKKWLDPTSPPSFSSKREMINNIAKHADLAEYAGIVVVVVFVVISMVVVYNTIRMAIFNRKDEIYMMRLIGAEPSFVRNPFIVEAIFNSMISAIAATSLGMILFDLIKTNLDNYGIKMSTTVDLMTKYWPVVFLGMILIGALIGIVSSFLATGKYLKEKQV
ncbi:MAG: permease-like cell division protein FtsX [Candidatus Saccharibacteria bacterium]|nr:permease-like cell division protein FtsX [Candidatus Saccharibacteria bacterium]